METKRRIALAVTLVATGLGVGHLVQRQDAREHAQMAAASGPVPVGVTQVSAGPEPAAPQALPETAPAAIAGTAPDLTPAATATEAPASVAAAPATPDPAIAPPAPPAPEATAEAPDATPPSLAVPSLGAPSLGAKINDLAATIASQACAPTLDLTVEDNAMIGLTLTAPCNPDERVVLRHAGLAVTARTTAAGSLFLSLPALEPSASVSVLFKSSETVEAAIEVPEVAGMRRFAVQWMADDAFQVHAFENGADYDTPGHVSAASPRTPLPGVPAAGGFLTVLGDGSVDLPMLAEVYSWPQQQDTPVEVVVEAAVTTATCGREVLGETLTSVGGEVFITDLTLAMPECEAAGDILVLKNLVPDLKLAAAN